MQATSWRPVIHFTPESGWMNDPNGTIFINGQYHLFYQKNPESEIWGPMYWGHAVSSDLLHWQHLPIAMAPDKLGYIYSGCCVLDRDHASRLGQPDQPPLIAIYTNHDPVSHLEVQSLSFSTDLIHFTKYACNPIIANPGLHDFRDPKVFRSPDGNGFHMAIAAGDRILFYHSSNLLAWEKTGEFLLQPYGLAGVVECPDCFPLPTPEGICWVLTACMIMHPKDGSHPFRAAYYFLGQFDGSTFHDSVGNAMLLSGGADYYSVTSFMDSPKQQRILIAWSDNFEYAQSTPARGYRGQMSLPVSASLKNTTQGLRLALHPLGLDHMMQSTLPFTDHMDLRTQSFGLIVRGTGKSLISIHNQQDEFLIEIEENRMRIDRTHAGISDFSDYFADPLFAVAEMPRLTSGSYEITMLFDGSVFEIFAEEGLLHAALTVYPNMPYEEVSLRGNLQGSMFQLC